MRTAAAVTFAVWKALFLREAVTRISKRRFAWVWLLLEPAVHIVFLMFIMSVIRLRRVDGMETSVWIMVGLLVFFMFRRPATQGMNAVSANEALFAYRQVKPVDTVLVRAALDGFLMVLITLVLLAGGGLFGLAVLPADPLAALAAFFGMWLLGLGFALLASVASELVPELGNVLQMLMAPLYFFSGIIFPLTRAPYPYRGWLLLNPLVHGVESARQAFSSTYHALSAAELNLAYLYTTSLAMVFLGLALHIRFAVRLVAR